MPNERPGTPAIPEPPDPASTLATAQLVLLAKGGDGEARETLFRRYLPRLRRWAAGRLPVHARSLLDTNDLAQDTLFRVLEGMHRIEMQRTDSFQAYVRQALLNRVRDQVRWASLRKPSEQPMESLHDNSPSPLEYAIGAETLERYERAFASLDPAEQELLHLRIELDCSYDEIATVTGRPTRDAARMAFQRALSRLANAMDPGPTRRGTAL